MEAPSFDDFMKRVFAVMPFADHTARDLYEHSTKPVCKRLGLEARRADEILSTNSIIDDIMQAIQESAVIIVDISGKNANVQYELGISHVLKPRQTIVITRDDYKELPFDIAHLRVIRYTDSIQGKAQYEAKLEGTLQTILQDFRLILGDIFDTLLEVLGTGEEVDLYALLAVAASPRLLSKDEKFEFHGHNDETGDRASAEAFSVGAELEPFIRIGFAETKGDFVILSQKGKAFADLLRERGFVCDYVNGQVITVGYDPANQMFTRGRFKG